jgi:hypothetical protein
MQVVGPSVPPIISSEVTPRSYNKNPEDCFLSEEGNPVRRNPQRILVLCQSGAPGLGVCGDITNVAGIVLYEYTQKEFQTKLTPIDWELGIAQSV